MVRLIENTVKPGGNSEYKVDCRLEGSPWSVAQWLREKEPSPDASSRDAPEVTLPSGSSLARDQDDQWVALLPAEYLVSILHDRNEGFEFRDTEIAPTFAKLFGEREPTEKPD